MADDFNFDDFVVDEDFNDLFSNEEGSSEEMEEEDVQKANDDNQEVEQVENNTPIQEVEENEEEIDTSQVKAYYDLLKEKGLLVLDDTYEFDGTPEGLEKAMDVSRNNLVNEGIKMVLESMPSDIQPIIQYALEGGKDIKGALERLSQVTSTGDLFESPDFEDDAYNERLLREHYKKTTKFSDTKINKLIETFRASDMLEDEARSAFEELKEVVEAEKTKLVEEQKKQREIESQQLQAHYNNFKSLVESMEEVPQERKQEVIKAVWTPIKVGNQTMSKMNYIQSKIMQKPEHVAQYVNLLLDYDEEKGFKKLVKTKEKKETELTSSFRDKLMKTLGGKPKTTGVDKTGKKSNFNFEEFLSNS